MTPTNEPTSEARQTTLSKVHEILYKFEQRSHCHRIDALSERNLTTKLATDKAQAAIAIMALFQLTLPTPKSKKEIHEKQN